MRGLIATIALAAALLLCGCGAKDDRPVLKIAFVGDDAGALADRVKDMRDAAALAVDNTGADTRDHRLQLVSGRDPDAVATIVAPGAEVEGLSLTLPLWPAGVDRGADVWLIPAEELTRRARAQYLASGLPRSSRVVLDDPRRPGTPTSTYVTPALSADNYPPAGRRFFDWFADEYGHTPDRYAIYAYEAVSFIVDAIQRVEKSGSPVTVERVKQQGPQIRDRFGPIGHYDVLPGGSVTSFVFQARGKPSPPPEAALIETRR